MPGRKHSARTLGQAVVLCELRKGCFHLHCGKLKNKQKKNPEIIGGHYVPMKYAVLLSAVNAACKSHTVFFLLLWMNVFSSAMYWVVKYASPAICCAKGFCKKAEDVFQSKSYWSDKWHAVSPVIIGKSFYSASPLSLQAAYLMLGDSQAGVRIALALQNSLNDLWKRWSENSLSTSKFWDISVAVILLRLLWRL